MPSSTLGVVWVAGERCPPRGQCGCASPHSGAVHHDGVPGELLLTSRAAWVVHWVRVRAQGPAVRLGFRGATAVMALAPSLLSRHPTGPGEGEKSCRGAQLSSGGVGGKRVGVDRRSFSYQYIIYIDCYVVVVGLLTRELEARTSYTAGV